MIRSLSIGNARVQRERPVSQLPGTWREGLHGSVVSPCRLWRRDTRRSFPRALDAAEDSLRSALSGGVIFVSLFPHSWEPRATDPSTARPQRRAEGGEMRVKMIPPALLEWPGTRTYRPIKWLFPPLGLLTLASHLAPDDEVVVQDEHVETLDLDEPDLVVIQVYATSARRAYEIADGYRRKGAPRRPRGPARDVSARGGRSPRRLDLSRAGRRHFSALPQRVSSGPAGPRLPLAEKEPAWASACAPRPAEAAPLSRAEHHRRVAGLPALLRVLLQAGLLRRRGGRSTRSGSTTPWRRSRACLAATSSSSTTTSSAARGSPGH